MAITKALKNTVIGLIIQDADVLSEIICKAALDYRVQDIKRSFRRLLKHEILTSAIHEVMAQIPRKN